MSNPSTISIDWGAHPRCRQCDKQFERDLPRAAAIKGLKVAGVFHEHCWPVFEAAFGHKVHTLVPYPLDSTKKKTELRAR